jgi:hypothetical protein
MIVDVNDVYVTKKAVTIDAFADDTVADDVPTEFDVSVVATVHGGAWSSTPMIGRR